MSSLKIIQVGLGPMGQRLVADFVQQSIGTIVGIVDRQPALVGKRLFDIDAHAFGGVLGDIAVASDLSDLDDRGANAAFVTTSSALERTAPTLISLIERGLTIVSSCEELSYPWLRHASLADELDAACRTHGGRLLGTGINPGFLMDTLPMVASGLCHHVDRVDVERVQDASTRRLPFQQKIGAGLDLDEFQRRVDAGTLRHVGLGESLHFIASALGFAIDTWDEQISPLVADEALECGLGTIAAGHARGVEQIAEGRSGGEVRIRLQFRAGIAEPAPRDRVRIDGTPSIDLRLEGGIGGDTGTTAVMMNAMLALQHAEPGLHTMASIPPIRCARGQERLSQFR